MSILKILDGESFDFHGNSPVEVVLCASNDLFQVTVPRSDSAGIYEVLEIQENNKMRYTGRVSTSIKLPHLLCLARY